MVRGQTQSRMTADDPWLHVFCNPSRNPNRNSNRKLRRAAILNARVFLRF